MWSVNSTWYGMPLSLQTPQFNYTYVYLYVDVDRHSYCNTTHGWKLDDKATSATSDHSLRSQLCQELDSGIPPHLGKIDSDSSFFNWFRFRGLKIKLIPIPRESVSSQLLLTSFVSYDKMRGILLFQIWDFIKYHQSSVCKRYTHPKRLPDSCPWHDQFL